MTKVLQHRRWISGTRHRAVNGALAVAVLVLPTVVVTQSVQAQSFSVLYSFTVADGDDPKPGLVRDKEGNLYGTTFGGGTSGGGIVFKLDTADTETVLHSFSGPDGANPAGGLVRDKEGNLYGTTFGGGLLNCFGAGCGVVFKLDTTNTETVLHSFTGPDGAFPEAGLVRDKMGNFYGTTSGGGPSRSGTVFKLDTTGAETVLHSFTGGADGANPVAGLVRDKEGNLYGTTVQGGNLSCNAAPSGCGVVFKIDTTGTETVLHSFTGGADGAILYGGLVRDKAGNLYGTTSNGGASGVGTVFKITP